MKYVLSKSNKLGLIHFSDDATVYLSNPNLNLLQIQINHEVVRINNWLSANKLSLNIMKYEFMIVTNCRIDVNSAVKFRNSEIERVNSTKFLGM